MESRWNRKSPALSRPPRAGSDRRAGEDSMGWAGGRSWRVIEPWGAVTRLWTHRPQELTVWGTVVCVLKDTIHHFTLHSFLFSTYLHVKLSLCIGFRCSLQETRQRSGWESQCDWVSERSVQTTPSRCTHLYLHPCPAQTSALHLKGQDQTSRSLLLKSQIYRTICWFWHESVIVFSAACLFF